MVVKLKLWKVEAPKRGASQNHPTAFRNLLRSSILSTSLSFVIVFEKFGHHMPAHRFNPQLWQLRSLTAALTLLIFSLALLLYRTSSPSVWQYSTICWQHSLWRISWCYNLLPKAGSDSWFVISVDLSCHSGEGFFLLCLKVFGYMCIFMFVLLLWSGGGCRGEFTFLIDKFA